VICLNQREALSSASSRKRQPARKVVIASILSNGILQNRINIVGVIIGKNNEAQASIDDGTGQLFVRASGNNFSMLSVGEIVSVIGRISEFNNTKYISAEIVKKIKDPLWIKVHNHNSKRNVELKVEQHPNKPAQDEPRNSHERILECIRKLDRGQGVTIDEIIEATPIKECEEIVNALIRDGEIFEIGPGKIKILE